MIIQGSDLLLALGAPQASGEYRDETHGAASFTPFLTQDLEMSDSLLACLAPSSQPPTRVLPLQLRLFNLSLEPSISNLVDVGEVGQQEQEHRVLKEILDALQDLFPAMIPDVLVPSHNAPTTPTEDVPTLALPREGGKGAFGFSQGGGQASEVGEVRQVLAHHGNSTAAAVADPPVPELRASLATGNVQGAPLTETPESSHGTGHAYEASPEPQIETRTTGAHLTVPVQGDEVALGNAVRENPYGETDATAATPSPARQPAEGASGHALAHGDVGGFTSHAAKVQRSAEQPPAAGLLRQAQPPEQQAVGSLRYFPLPHSTVLLQLDPPELGTLFVQVCQVDEQLTASFWAESSEVRSLLQAHFPNLNQVLSQQGLSAQQISLHLATGDGFAEQFGQFSQQHAAAQSFSHGNHGETSAGRQRDLDRAAERRQPSNGRVDITI